MSTPKFEWDRPNYTKSTSKYMENVVCANSAEECIKDAHAICVLTEWDRWGASQTFVTERGGAAATQGFLSLCLLSIADRLLARDLRRRSRRPCRFKDYDYKAMYDQMSKPAFVFDGRNLLNHEKVRGGQAALGIPFWSAASELALAYPYSYVRLVSSFTRSGSRWTLSCKRSTKRPAALGGHQASFSI